MWLMGWQWDVTLGEKKHRACEDEQVEWIGDKIEWDQAGDEPMGLWMAVDVSDWTDKV